MSANLIDSLLDSLDEQHLDRLAALLAPRLPATSDVRSPYLDTDEAAAYLRSSKQRIYDLTSAGRLEPCRDGSRLLFHRAHLDAYLEERAA